MSLCSNTIMSVFSAMLPGGIKGYKQVFFGFLEAFYDIMDFEGCQIQVLVV